ncbi:Protein fam72a [Boothiomyces sp. JEL0866]|nr:Protein fam72a [Boothiomyces sp. JEL0866]
MTSREPEIPAPQAQPNISDFTTLQHEFNSVGVGSTFHPSTHRLRQAAAQALARSHHNRSGRIQIQQISPRRASSSGGAVNPSIHPQFRSKTVCNLYCSHCESRLCERGMRAILLGNTSVELYSTDRPPFGVALVDKDYFTKNCSCRIRDAACLGCGNVVGYHVTHPCDRCLDSCNNGHFWMFLSDAVWSKDRLEKSGNSILKWSSLAGADDALDHGSHTEKEYNALCR